MSLKRQCTTCCSIFHNNGKDAIDDSTCYQWFWKFRDETEAIKFWTSFTRWKRVYNLSQWNYAQINRIFQRSLNNNRNQLEACDFTKIEFQISFLKIIGIDWVFLIFQSKNKLFLTWIMTGNEKWILYVKHLWTFLYQLDRCWSKNFISKLFSQSCAEMSEE